MQSANLGGGLCSGYPITLATSQVCRISHRNEPSGILTHFHLGNYLLIIALLVVYSLCVVIATRREHVFIRYARRTNFGFSDSITNPLLLISIVFMVGGWTAISQFGMLRPHSTPHTEANANVNVTSVRYSPGVVPSRRKHDHPEASFHWSLRDWHPYVPRGWTNWNCFLAYWSFECVDSRSRMSP